MKNLITAIASILLIMAMFMQMTANQRTYTKLIAIDQLVNNFKEVAREEGYISSSNKSKLIKEISSVTSTPSSDISVSGTSSKVSRGKAINYRVDVKIGGVMAAPGFWGLSKKENSGIYTINQSTTSEYVSGK